MRSIARIRSSPLYCAADGPGEQNRSYGNGNSWFLHDFDGGAGGNRLTMPH
jgi:hypothetical protein